MNAVSSAALERPHSGAATSRCPRGRPARRLPASILRAALLAPAALPPGAAGANGKSVWLCRPGIPSNPCTPGMTTSHLGNDGNITEVERPPIDHHPATDCFYLY